ncbi:hypothetical protein AAFF_G00097590 [Aldrovandia affinis]|uniref:Zinc finger CCHC domain-containing protein 7 n=1 Tax=Aldrovandia affinis TaxID=143900 RepID=A0AAD7RXV1_9TELE|nr:hypothetical protein AAFF_G00097590 [Aldrovandia affinis]
MAFLARDTHVDGYCLCGTEPLNMFSGYRDDEEYEDELYREDEDSRSSGAESEVEVRLYSQLHYSTGLGQREEEELGQRQGETGDGEGGGDPQLPSSPGRGQSSMGHCCFTAQETTDQHWSSGGDSDLDLDSDGVESWMILDEEEQEGDANILLNVEFGVSSSSTDEDEDDAHNWTVSEKDMEAQIGNPRPALRRTNRYYNPNPNESVTCRSCRKTGHLAQHCPTPKKCPSCLLCGTEGHLPHACPGKHCPNCCLPGHGYEDCLELAYWHKQCRRCGATGHFHDACPDIWRQYHLTTRVGVLVKPGSTDAHRRAAYCYNCARRGHFGFVCGQRRMSSGIYANVPFVSHYDTPEDVRQRDSRMQRKAKELQDAGLLLLTTDPQGGAREEEPINGSEAARQREDVAGEEEGAPTDQEAAEGGNGSAHCRGGASEAEEEERHFLRGPETIPSVATTPPAKGQASPGLFGSGKRGDRKTKKCRDRKRCQGRKQGALKREAIFPSDENFIPIKSRTRHRKR